MKKLNPYKDLLTRYLHNDCSAQELEIVVQVFQDPDLAPELEEWLQETWQHDHYPTSLESSHKSELLAGIHKHINQKEKIKNPFTIWNYAAILLMLLLSGGVFYYLNGFEPTVEIWTTYQTEKGQRKTIILSDGSTLYLNSQSSISFPKVFHDTLRLLKLQGEAFFEVQPDPDRPFIVQSGEVKTKVIGTSFNINSYDREKVEVTVSTGRVMVSATKDQKDILLNSLTASQQITYNQQNRQYKMQKVNTAHLFSWKNNYLLFENEPLAKVAPVLERWYGVDITFANQNVKDCELNIRIEDESLLSVMNTLSIASDIEYNWLAADNILVISGNCD